MIKNQTTLPSKFQIMSHPHQWEPGIVRIPCHWERLSGKASPAYHGDRGDKEHSFQPGGYWNRRNIDGTDIFNFFSQYLLCMLIHHLFWATVGEWPGLLAPESLRGDHLSFGPTCVQLIQDSRYKGRDLVGNQPTVWYNCLQTTAASRLTNRMTSPDALTFLHASPSGSGYPQSHRVTAQFTAFTATLPTGTSLSQRCSSFSKDTIIKLTVTWKTTIWILLILETPASPNWRKYAALSLQGLLWGSKVI